MTGSDQPMAAMEAYLGRVQGVLVAANATIPPAEMRQAQQLVDHGEPAEGLLELAWVITRGDHRVPGSVVDGIKELTAGLVPAGELPDNLDKHIA